MNILWTYYEVIIWLLMGIMNILWTHCELIIWLLMGLMNISWTYYEHIMNILWTYYMIVNGYHEHIIWLVVTGTWLIFFQIYWERHHPNWLIFFRGVETSTTNQLWTYYMIVMLMVQNIVWLPSYQSIKL